MDKYGMIESVDEVSTSGMSGASSLTPESANTSGSNDNSPVNLAPKNPLNGLATELSPNIGGKPVISPPIGGDIKSPAMEKLKQALVKGANQASLGKSFNMSNQFNTTSDPNLNPSEPQESASKREFEKAIKAESIAPAIQAPQPSPAISGIIDRKGIQGWNIGGAFVELPQGIDRNDSRAVEAEYALSKDIINLMNDDEEDWI